MGIRYLLDTNVISEPLRPIPNPHITLKLKEHNGEIAIASVILHELLYGMERLPPSQRRQKIEDYLANVIKGKIPVLPYDETASSWHAVQRARLEKRGLITPFFDGQIAAIAKCNELTLVTRNTKDFKLFDGLRVQDWFR